jgi:predicted DNA-binding antitoxin AbrB/MazE fold protein
MEKMDIEAVYEHGTLKLPQALPLPDGQKVTITVHPPAPVKRRRVVMEWSGSQADLDDLILSDENDPLEAS